MPITTQMIDVGSDIQPNTSELIPIRNSTADLDFDFIVIDLFMEGPDLPDYY